MKKNILSAVVLALFATACGSGASVNMVKTSVAPQMTNNDGTVADIQSVTKTYNTYNFTITVNMNVGSQALSIPVTVGGSSQVGSNSQSSGNDFYNVQIACSDLNTCSEYAIVIDFGVNGTTGTPSEFSYLYQDNNGTEVQQGYIPFSDFGGNASEALSAMQ
jgi:hypothetical protein